MDLSTRNDQTVARDDAHVSVAPMQVAVVVVVVDACFGDVALLDIRQLRLWLQIRARSIATPKN